MITTAVPARMQTEPQRPLRIVHVVESLAIGGLERVVLALSGWQMRRGQSPRIVCLFDEGALAPQAAAQGIEVVALDKRAGVDLRAARRLRAVLREAVPDVLHTHNPMSHYYAAAASLGLGIRRVVNTRHGMGPSGGSSSRLERLYRLSLSVTDDAVAVCHAGRDRFVAAGIIPPRLARVVHNGIDVGAFGASRGHAGAALRSEFGIAWDAVIVGTVGRLSAVKDMRSMLEAVSLLDRDLPWMLVIVGDGEQRRALEQAAGALGIATRVRFAGMRADVPELLGGFDVFVQSSRSEGYSLALVEAAASGLPIVATRVGGNAEIVADAGTGHLVPAAQPQALARALEPLVADAGLRQRMGAAGRRWALAHGSIDAMGQSYLDLYEGRDEGAGCTVRSSGATGLIEGGR